MITTTLGRNIDLSLMVKRNNFPWTGQTVTVRVVEKSGVELLAATTVPETSEPGLYRFLWESPPIRETELAAIYTLKGRCYTEGIQLVSSSAQKSNRLKGVITQSRLKGVISMDTDPVVQLKGTIRQSRLVGKLTQGRLSGVIKQTRLTGTIREV